MSHLDAHELIDLVLDDGSWTSWDGPVDESVLTGEGLMRGRRVAVRGRRVRLPGRVDRPGRRRPAGRRASSAPPPRGCRCSPAPVSGGTRMQEGTAAFVQMVRISAADRRRTRRPACPTSSTCGTRPPAA